MEPTCQQRTFWNAQETEADTGDDGGGDETNEKNCSLKIHNRPKSWQSSKYSFHCHKWHRNYWSHLKPSSDRTFGTLGSIVQLGAKLDDLIKTLQTLGGRGFLGLPCC